MRRRGGTTVTVLTLALGVSALLLLIFEPWRGLGEGEFRVLGFEPQDRPLARNEPIHILFDRPIHPETPLEALIRVEDARGRRLGLRIERQGKSVSILPRAPLGWPGRESISVKISPGLAVPFRARDHASLSAPVEAEFEVSDGYFDFGTSFHLKLAAPTSLVAVPRGTVFRFDSDLPIDAESLRGGRAAVTVAVIGGDRGQRTFEPQLGLAGDGRGLVVTPWQNGETFDRGLRHRMTLHKGRLRSVTGRVLERDLVVEFRSNPDDAFEGQVDISFALVDLDTESREALNHERGFAEPVLTLFNSVELGAKEDQEEPDRDPTVFGREPNRLQILVPGSHLGDEPGLITGFAFFAGADPADPTQVLHRDLILPRVVFRLGEAATAASRGLLPDPTLNFADPGPLETVALGSHEGEIILERRLRQGAYGGWIDIAFERPFPYRGGSRDLVLEVVNDAGAFALDGEELPVDWQGPVWARSSSRRVNPGQEAQSLALTARLGENGGGIPSPAIFATKFQIERYQELVTRWYEVEAQSPTWFRVPAVDQFEAEGAEGRDFVVDFQGLEPNGQPGPWTRLEDLSGCRKIRARLRFLPDADWRFSGVQVRRLRVRFRDGR